MILEAGVRYRMRNGGLAHPTRSAANGGMRAWVNEGWHTGECEWTRDGMCIGGSTTFSDDLSQFDIDVSRPSPRRVVMA